MGGVSVALVTFTMPCEFQRIHETYQLRQFLKKNLPRTVRHSAGTLLNDACALASPQRGEVGGGYSADGILPPSLHPPGRPPSSPPPAGGRSKPAATCLRGRSVTNTPTGQRA